MEVLVEIIGEIVLTVLQEVWPPILAVVNGLLVLVLGFLTWLFFTEGEPARAVISLLLVVLFGAVGLACLKAGVYTRKGSVKRRRKK